MGGWSFDSNQYFRRDLCAALHLCDCLSPGCLVAVQKDKVVLNFGAEAKGTCWIASESDRAGLSICLRILPILCARFPADYTLGLCAHQLLDSMRALVGSQLARPKASSVALAARQPGRWRLLDHGSNWCSLASTLRCKLFTLSSYQFVPLPIRAPTNL